MSCIPVSQLVSCAFSPIPICPLSIQRIFHLLVSTLFLLELHSYDLALGQKAVHHFTKLRDGIVLCSYIRRLAEPSPLLGRGCAGLGASYESYMYRHVTYR